MLGRWRKAKYMAFMSINDAVRITAEEMKKDDPGIDLLSKENDIRLYNRIGGRDTTIVRKILMEM